VNKHDVRLLQAINHYPSVSILLPTHRTAPDNRQDPIRLKNLISEATNRLLNEFSKRDSARLLDNLEKLVEQIDFQRTLDGLAVYVNDDFARAFVLPFDVNERVVIDQTFATRDLVYALNRTSRYWVLVLSEQPTRLYEGTKSTLVEVREGSQFPLTHGDPGGGSQLPGGVGVNRSAYRDEYHRKFFRKVDEAFSEVAADDPLPLVVVGVDRLLSFFQEVSAHRSSIIATLQGSHDKTSPHELGELVWPLAKEAIAQERNKVFDELDAAIKSQKFTSTIGEVWRKAHDGRGDLLIVEEGFHFPARVDESGRHITPADDATAPDVIDDAVDEVIEMVLQKGGRVRFVDDDTLKDHQRITLLLRY
jgi:hypothetical protein